jgi:hypothetical protein
MTTEWVETDTKRSVWINCLAVDKFPFVISNGYHHKLSIQRFQRLQNI